MSEVHYEESLQIISLSPFIILYSAGVYFIFPLPCDFKISTDYTRRLKYNLFLAQRLAAQLAFLL